LSLDYANLGSTLYIYLPVLIAFDICWETVTWDKWVNNC